MPQVYTDAEGNEVELLTPEEQKALQEKVAEKEPEEKKVEEKVEEEVKVPSLEDIDKELVSLKTKLEQKELSEKEQWFEDQVGVVIEDEEQKKKVRQYFDILETREGTNKKAALADALTLVMGTKVNPFNGVSNYNQNSGVPGSEKEGDEIKKIAQKFNSNLPPGFKLSK